MYNLVAPVRVQIPSIDKIAGDLVSRTDFYTVNLSVQFSVQSSNCKFKDCLCGLCDYVVCLLFFLDGLLLEVLKFWVWL